MEDLESYEPSIHDHRALVHQAEVRGAVDVGVLHVDEARVRTRYADGQILGADGFNRDQKLFLRRQQDLGRLVSRGVVEGLTVEQPLVSGGESEDVPDPTRLIIAAGHGVTRSGETVVLRDSVEIDLTDLPTFQRLDADFRLDRRPRPPARTQSGVFALVLRPVEYTANPVAPYPKEITGQRRLEDGDVIEATAITLVPIASESSLDGIDAGPAALARRIFVEDVDPVVSHHALPLAAVALERGTIAWIDVHCVRREAKADPELGFGAGHRSTLEAHMRHFAARMDSILARLPPAPLATRFAATDYFEVLPPAGELPPTSVSVEGDRLAQWFFPAAVDADLALVPEDELPALLEEAMTLSAYDLSQAAKAAEATPMLMVIPVSRERFVELVPQFVDGTRRRIGPRLGSYARRRPVDALLRRVQRPLASLGGPTSPALLPWETALAEATSVYFFRQRRRARTSFALPRSGPIPLEQRPSATLPLAIRMRIEAAGELARFDRVFAQAGPDALDRIAAVLSLPWFGSDPLFVNGVMAELSSYTRRRLLEPGTVTVGGSSISVAGVPAGAPAPLRLRPVTLEEADAVASRYEGPPELGDGMAALRAFEGTLGDLGNRLVIAQSLRLPELDDRIRETRPEEHPALAAVLLGYAVSNDVNAIRDLVGYIRAEPPPLETPRYDTGPPSTGFAQAEAIGQSALFTILWNHADDLARVDLDALMNHSHSQQPLVATVLMMGLLREAWGITLDTPDDAWLLIERLYRWPFSPEVPFVTPTLGYVAEPFVSRSADAPVELGLLLDAIAAAGPYLAGLSGGDYSIVSDELESALFPPDPLEAVDAYRILGCAFGSVDLASQFGDVIFDFPTLLPDYVSVLLAAVATADMARLQQLYTDTYNTMNGL